MTSMPLRCAQISNCSTAAARNVSAAQSTTLRPSWRSRLASLPMLVVLPAPFTPTMKITRVPLPFCEVEIPLAVATSGLAGAFKMRTRCDLISCLSCVASASALRSIFSRTASRISRVGFTPKSAERSAVPSARVYDQVNLLFGPTTHCLANLVRQFQAQNTLIAEKYVAVASYADQYGILFQGTWH